MRILGIDPGATVTGYGVVEARRDGRLAGVAYGVVRSKGREFHDRLASVYDGLTEVITRHAPDEIAIEDLFYAANVKTALKLGHARGVALLAAAHRKVPIAAYSPMEIKRGVVGYGRAEKQQVNRMVCVLLGLGEPPDPFDASDALAVAICHCHASRLGRMAGAAR